MRIERIRIEGFGRLACFDTGEAPLSGIVVLLGPNEAGKSTIFHFLTTILYGFKPASRETNPFVPWGGDEASGEAWLRLSDGRCARVARRLRSQPAGQLEVDDRVSELRNREVPWVGHIPRGVFRQVFAVTLGELASLDDETWGRIQDRVVGSMGATDLRPVRAVAEDLEREAGELWRPTRRGNQRVRELRERIRELRARRTLALERDREIRALVAEHARVADELRARREERERDNLVLERIHSLAPLRAQLARITTLRDEVGPEERLDGLPSAPVERYEALRGEREEIARRALALAAERVEPEAAIQGSDPGALRFVEMAEEIREVATATAATGAERARLRELEGEVEALAAKLDAAAFDLCGRSWHSELGDVVGRLSIPTLRDAVERVTEARLRLADAETREAGAAGSASGPWALASALLLAVGIPLTVSGAMRAAVPWMVGGLVLAVLGLGMGALALGRERRARAAGRERREAAAAAAEEGRRRLEDLVRDAPLRPGLLEQPGESLIGALERAQELAEEHAHRTRTLRSLADRVEAVEGGVRDLASRIGFRWRAGDDTATVARRLADRLREAERAVAAAEVAARDLRRMDREQEGLDGRSRRVERELEALARAALRFRETADSAPEADAAATDSNQNPIHDPGIVIAGLRRAEACLRARSLVERLEEELRRDHPDIGALEARIAEAERAGAAWSLGDEELARRRARSQEHAERIEALVERQKEIEGLIERAAEEETADAVDGEIAALEEEIQELVRERDRKWVLAQLLREADRRFRDEHQPDLVRRASGYLAHLTTGRYDRLLIEEAGAGDLFAIQGPAAAGPVPLRHPVSTGTLEQAYLSLRLAMVDHLDHGVEALPLFIDEIFVNWDRERRARGLEVLGRIAATRQVFVFTCHAEVAGALADGGARVIRLDRSR